MRIDPVIAIAEDLHRAETMICDPQVRRDEELCRQLLSDISALNQHLFRAVPTTVLGAAEMLQRACLLVRENSTPVAGRMQRIAGAFARGERSLMDLVWLRRAAADMTAGLYNEEGVAAATLVLSALHGASRPVLVFRAVSPAEPDFMRQKQH